MSFLKNLTKNMIFFVNKEIEDERALKLGEGPPGTTRDMENFSKHWAATADGVVRFRK